MPAPTKTERRLVHEIARLRQALSEIQSILTNTINDLRAAGAFNHSQRSSHRSSTPAHTEDDLRRVLHGKGGDGK